MEKNKQLKIKTLTIKNVKINVWTTTRTSNHHFGLPDKIIGLAASFKILIDFP